MSLLLLIHTCTNKNIISINKGKKMMGDKKIEDIEKEDKIKKCLRLIKKGLGTRGSELPLG